MGIEVYALEIWVPLRFQPNKVGGVNEHLSTRDAGEDGVPQHARTDLTSTAFARRLRACCSNSGNWAENCKNAMQFFLCYILSVRCYANFPVVSTRREPLHGQLATAARRKDTYYNYIVD